MKFKTHNENRYITTGGITSLQGHIDISYKELVKIFGESDCWDDYKTDAEWDIEFEDRTVATIYNYKTGKNYLGEEGLSKEEIRDWHIGGRNKRAVELVHKAVEDFRE